MAIQKWGRFSKMDDHDLEQMMHKNRNLLKDSLFKLDNKFKQCKKGRLVKTHDN